MDATVGIPHFLPVQPWRHGDTRERLLTSLLSASLQRGAQAVVRGLCAGETTALGSLPRYYAARATMEQTCWRRATGFGGLGGLAAAVLTDGREDAAAVTRVIDCQMAAGVGRDADETRRASEVKGRGWEDFWARQGAGSGAR
jgi:hypothetical protein